MRQHKLGRLASIWSAWLLPGSFAKFVKTLVLIQIRRLAQSLRASRCCALYRRLIQKLASPIKTTIHYDDDAMYLTSSAEFPTCSRWISFRLETQYHGIVTRAIFVRFLLRKTTFPSSLGLVKGTVSSRWTGHGIGMLVLDYLSDWK